MRCCMFCTAGMLALAAGWISTVWHSLDALLAHLMRPGIQRMPEAKHGACLASVCRTALHRALYFGHFRCAAVLLEAGASLTVLDHKVFTQFRQLSWLVPCWCTTEQCSICLLRAALKATFKLA